jgi:alpha-ribazole phosphatase
MQVALVRHPAAQIAAGICYGRTDLALSAEGLAALPRMADAVAGFTARCIWTSPARRCLAVAVAVAATRSLDILRDDRLLELDFGDWEGRNWNDVPRAALDRWAASPERFSAPGGESVSALIDRVGNFHNMLRRDGRDCIVVSHGGVLRVLRPLLRGEAVDLLVPAPALGAVEIVTVISAQAGPQPLD